MSVTVQAQLSKRLVGTRPWDQAAAILEDFIVIPRADLPAVERVADSRNVYTVGAGEWFSVDEAKTAATLAMSYLAIAEHLDAQQKAEAEAEAKLDTEVRRLTGTVIETGHPSLRGIPVATIRGVVAALVTAGKVTP